MGMGFIVSAAMEAAFRGSANYAGGLGVLETDKFYAAGRIGLPYILIVPFYPKGYVDYNVADRAKLVEVVNRHSFEFLSNLRHVKSISVKGSQGKLIAEADIYEYSFGSAKALLYRITRPLHIASLFEYLYRHHIDECTYYITAAAVASEIVKLIGNISIVDVQESHLALLLYMLPKSIRRRFITHTPGPWGHPRLCRSEAESLLDLSLPNVKTMTEAAMENADEVYTVSHKHSEITKKLFPKYADKIKYVTNGIDLERWRRIKEDPGSSEALMKLRLSFKEQLKSLISATSGKNIGDRLVVAWTRRIVKYKRPYFVERLVLEEDLRDRIFLVVAGKPHIWDHWGKDMAERFIRASRELDNIYFHSTYDTTIAYYLISGSDLLLFTPFPGWEASGTSHMKAMVNGVPVLSSKDGSSLELIQDNINGWLFGLDINEFIDIDRDARAQEIDELEYDDMVKKLVKIVNIYENDRDLYNSVSYNAYKTSIPFADINRVLKQYYPQYFSSP
ncbi:MAG: glycogen/starch/alpha-glucan phosphorylase [Acidilobaceae archaeon]